MSDVYKIAVKLSMESNAASVLSTLSRQLLHTHADVEKLHGSLLKLNRVKLAVFGGLSIVAGTGLIGLVKTTIDAAKELNHQLTTTSTLIANPAQSAALREQALAVARATTGKIAGVPLDKAVEIFNEAYSIVGSKNAAAINAPLAMYAKVAGSSSGDFEKAYDSIRELLKSGEMTGKIMNEETHKVDEGKLLGYLDMAAKVSAATAGRVNARTFFQMSSQGSAAVRQMTPDGMLGMLMASQQMGGFKVGTAAMSMFAQFAGGKMTGPVADELEKLGLVGKHETKGGGTTFEKGALDTPFTRELKKDALGAIQMLRDAMTKQGITGEAQGDEMFKIFGRQTTQRLMTDLMLGMENMVAERGRIKGAQGLEAQNKTRDSDDYETNLHNVHTAFGNLMAELGGPMMKSAIGVLQTLTSTLDFFRAQVVAMGPDNVRKIGEGVAILGAAFIGAGALALLAAIGAGGWLVIGIGALAAAVVAFGDHKAMGEIAAGLLGIGAAVATLDGKKLAASSKTLWQGIADLFKGQSEQTQAVINSTFVGVLATVVQRIAEIGPAFVTTVSAIPGQVQTAFASAIAKVSSVISDAVKTGLDLTKAISSMASTWVSEIAALPGLVGGAIKAAIGRLGSMFGDALQSLNPFHRTSFGGDDAGGGGGGGSGGGRLFNASYTEDGGGGGDVPSGAVPAKGSGGLYGAIMRSEIPNSKHPYSETLGYGAYGHPGDLTKMTLAEVYAASERIRRNPRNHTNAGPMGAFQMLGSTMMTHAKALGMDPRTTHFTPDVQQRLASHIASTQGLSAWEGFRHHPDELARARSAGVPRQSRKIEVHTKVTLDGKQIAKAVTKHQADDATFPHSIGGHDDYGSHLGSGSTTYGT